MGQQISIEAAYAAMRKKCMDLLEANVLLEARVAELEGEVESQRAPASVPTYAMSTADGQP
jgi:1-deoxy-D-xylulose 5-phosphate reductoisomerase